MLSIRSILHACIVAISITPFTGIHSSMLTALTSVSSLRVAADASSLDPIDASHSFIESLDAQTDDVDSDFDADDASVASIEAADRIQRSSRHQRSNFESTHSLFPTHIRSTQPSTRTHAHPHDFTSHHSEPHCSIRDQMTIRKWLLSIQRQCNRCSIHSPRRRSDIAGTDSVSDSDSDSDSDDDAQVDSLAIETDASSSHPEIPKHQSMTRHTASDLSTPLLSPASASASDSHTDSCSQRCVHRLNHCIDSSLDCACLHVEGLYSNIVQFWTSSCLPAWLHPTVRSLWPAGVDGTDAHTISPMTCFGLSMCGTCACMHCGLLAAGPVAVAKLQSAIAACNVLNLTPLQATCGLSGAGAMCGAAIAAMQGILACQNNGVRCARIAPAPVHTSAPVSSDDEQTSSRCAGKCKCNIDRFIGCKPLHCCGFAPEWYHRESKQSCTHRENMRMQLPQPQPQPQQQQQTDEAGPSIQPQVIDEPPVAQLMSPPTAPAATRPRTPTASTSASASASTSASREDRRFKKLLNQLRMIQL